MLREQCLFDGPDGLGDLDLLVLALGAAGPTDRRIAVELLEAWPDLATLARASPQALARVRGLGSVRALRLHAALQLGVRVQQRAGPRPASIRTCEDAASWLAPGLHGLPNEELHALYLDRRLKPICKRRLTVGNDSHTVVDSRQILKIAVEVGASALVLAHNHPSGDPEPSREDLQVTRVVVAAAEVLGVALLDHLVVGGGRWISLTQRGLPELCRGALGLALMTGGSLASEA